MADDSYEVYEFLSENDIKIYLEEFKAGLTFSFKPARRECLLNELDCAAFARRFSEELGHT